MFYRCFMSRRADLDAAALNAALLQAVKEAREAQNTLDEATRASRKIGTDHVPATAEGILERIALLAKLSDLGMAMVCALDERLRAAQAEAGPGVPLPLMLEAVDLFCKLSRSVRLIIMLEVRAEEALEALLRGRPEPRKAAPPIPAPIAVPVADAEPEVETLDETETLVDRESPPESPSKTATVGPASPRFSNDDVRAAARERLFLDRHYADFLTRPLDQLIPDLCRDLGFKPWLVREIGWEPRFAGAPLEPPHLPQSPQSPQPQPRRIPSTLAGPSSLVLDRAVALPPPRAP